MPPLTDAQTAFLEKYIKLPKTIGRKDAKKKREAWATEFRRFNTLRDELRDRIAKLPDPELRSRLLGQIAQAEEGIMANTKTPDFDGGHSRLIEIAKITASYQVFVDCERELALIRPRAEKLIATKPQNGAELQMMLSFAEERAANGLASGNAKDVKSALATIERLEEAMAQSLPSVPDQPTGQVKDTADALDLESVTLAARKPKLVKLAVQEERLAKLSSQLSGTFGDATAPSVETERLAIKKIIDDGKTGLTASIEPAANTASGRLDLFEPVVKTACDDRIAYEDRRAKLLRGDYAVLSAHKLIAHAVIIPMLATVDGHLLAAETAANLHDHTLAGTELGKAETATTAAIEAGDELAEYLDVKDDRAERMKPVAAIDVALRLHAQVDAAAKAAEDQWAEITTAFDAPAPDLVKLKALAPKLAEIPTLASDAVEIAKRAKDYDAQYANRFKEIAKLRGKISAFSPTETAVAKPMVDAFEAEVISADVATTGDFRISMSILAKTRAYANSIQSKIDEIGTMYSAQNDFDARLLEVQNLMTTPGGVALTDYEIRLNNDDNHANDRMAKGEFAGAAVTYAASATGHAEKIALHGVAAQYLTDRGVLEGRLNTVSTSGGAVYAADVIAAAQAGLDAAHAARQAKDWQGALDLLPLVGTRLDTAERAAKNGRAIDSRANQPGLATIATTPDAAFAVFDKCYEVVTTLGLDTGVFAKLSKEAADKRLAADAAVKATVPDYAAAAQSLTEGIAICKRLTKLEVDQTVCSNLRIEVRARYDDIKNKGLNDGYFDKKMEDFVQLFNDSLEDAKPDGFNFPEATRKIVQAREICQDIIDNTAHVKEAKEKHQTIKDLRDEMDGDPDLKPNMGSEITRLEVILKSITDDLDAEKPADAAKKARDGVQETKLIITIARDCRSYLEAVKDILEPAEKELADLPKSIALSDTYATEARQELTDLKDQITKAITARSYRTATTLVYRASGAVTRAYTAARSGAAYGERLGKVEPELNKLDQRTDPANLPLVAGMTRLKAQLADAKKLAGLQQNESAYNKLDGMVEAMAELEPLAKLHEAYVVALKGATDALADAAKLTNAEAVAPLLARARAGHLLGQDLGLKGEYAQATQALTDAAREAAEAIRAAADFAEYRQITEALVSEGSEPDKDGEALETALRRAEMAVADLKSGDGAMFIFRALLDAEAALAEARKLAATDAKGAISKLTDAMTLCAAARKDAGLYTQLSGSEAAATSVLEDLLKTHTQAGFIRDAGEAQLDRLAQAMQSVRRDPAKITAAETTIADVMVQYHDLRRIADAQAEVVALLAELEPGLETLDQHSHRYAVAKEVVKLHADVDSARDLAKAHDHANAIKLLKAALAAMNESTLMADMQAGAAPDQAMIKKLLAQDKGHEALDKLVAKLDDSTRKKVMIDVFKARFGCELVLYKTEGTDDFVKKGLETFKKRTPPPTDDQIENEAQRLKILDRSQNLDMDLDDKAPDIKRFYDAMAKLPPSDTLDNDSMKIFTSRGESQGSFYNSRRREVVMVEANGGDAYYSVGSAYELDDVQANCTPEPGENLSFFSWNTLHEVGHAADDKLGYMRKNGKALGGWENYGANVIPVAEAVNTHFDLKSVAFAAAYLKRRISFKPNQSRDDDASEKPDAPPPPTGVEVDEWERRLADACAYMDRIRVDKNPWQTAASAKASALDGVCYQESYGGTWTSYPFDQRKTGVTGYQFRAPGEWFSELYAAFHSKKMNASHPARVWLTNLG